ncbi:MAG TPA: outer membrane beta-barrel protein [Bacteroidales bacterium]|jgi:hypothetical protein|nr:outer membrane beta-barrel protein [Bacteroidales bacterium]
MTESSHIEEFFKKRLAFHEFTFQEEDWLKMERKLELSGLPSSEETPAHFPVRLIIIILAGLTAAFILGWLTSELIRDKKNNRSEVIEKSESSLLHAQTISPVLNPDPGKRNNSSLPENVRPSNGTESQPAVTENKPTAIMESEIDNQKLQAQTGPAPGADVETATSLTVDLVSVTEPISLALIPHENIDLLPVNYSRELYFPSISNTSNNAAVKRPFNRWSIGLLLAPDFNSTGFTHRKTVSPVIGGIFSYDLTPRWSLSARILYNNKKYSSSADYYNVPYDYWQYRTNGKIPDNIDGSCRVIDIPVLLTYLFYRKRAISFTASAGLGSYFLLDEKYKFTFNQDNPGADSEWNTEENSKVLFGVANLAIGLSVQTTQRTSFAVEPYFKLPLKQMGWANVNLSGMGLSFSFKYHF